MKKNISPFLKSVIDFVSIALLVVMVGCKEDNKNKDSASSQKIEPLQVVMSADYPPFEFYKDGKLVGFEVELIEMIARKLNTTAVIKDAPFESLIASIQAKRADVCISALSATEERLKMVDFSNSYHISKSVIITFDPTINTLDDLKEKNLGVQMGTTYEAFLKEWGMKNPKSQIQALSKVPDLVQNLKIGRIQAIMMGAHEAASLITTLRASHKEAKLIEVEGTDVKYAMALPKGSPYTQKINQILAELDKNGTLEELTGKWFTDPSKTPNSVSSSK